jgi:hypothetical protein
VHRSDATFVQSVWICPCFDEVRDDLILCISDSVVRGRSPICGVVDRLGTSSIASPDVCTSRHERPGDIQIMRGRCNMERRVARVDIVVN